jgi:hypothetical protein
VKLRGPLDLAEVQEGYSAGAEKVQISEGQEPSIGITRNVGSNRESAYREFVK